MIKLWAQWSQSTGLCNFVRCSLLEQMVCIPADWSTSTWLVYNFLIEGECVNRFLQLCLSIPTSAHFASNASHSSPDRRTSILPIKIVRIFRWASCLSMWFVLRCPTQIQVMMRLEDGLACIHTRTSSHVDSRLLIFEQYLVSCLRFYASRRTALADYRDTLGYLHKEFLKVALLLHSHWRSLIAWETWSAYRRLKVAASSFMTPLIYGKRFHAILQQICW